jgi:hypothetical protein
MVALPAVIVVLQLQLIVDFYFALLMLIGTVTPPFPPLSSEIV